MVAWLLFTDFAEVAGLPVKFVTDLVIVAGLLHVG